MKDGIDALLRAADDAMRAGRPAAAEQHWNAVIGRQPEHPVALNGLGMLALRAADRKRAAAFFLRAAEASPTAVVLWLNHARVARDLGDDVGERASLLRAYHVEPTSLIVNVRLAENAERSADIRAATERWNAVVSLAQAGGVPDDARAAVDHARAFLRAQSEKLGAHVDAELAGAREAIAPADRRRIDTAIESALGRRPIYLNQCAGLHIPFLPADEYFERRHFPWLSDLEQATETIREELLSSLAQGREGFEPYVALPSGTPRNVWSTLDGSLDWSTLHLWRHGRRDDAVCARFPRTADLLDSLPLARLPDRMPTIFFSILAPHAHIPPHTGVTNARAIVHLPLIVPVECRFRVGGETRPWVEGEAFVFDDTIEHEAWNDSDEPRVVLILDAWNPYLHPAERELLAAFYEASETSGIAPTLAEATDIDRHIRLPKEQDRFPIDSKGRP